MSGILEIQHLHKKIDQKTILDDISFSVAEGEVVSIIWPSWWGKTSIIRAIGGLEPFDAGEIKVADKKISAASSHEDAKEAREYMGMVFQEYNIRSHMTVLENITKPLLLTKSMDVLDAQEVAMQWLKKVHLEHKANAYPKSLSGGQKQRVAIARALACNPKLLLLDEITSALDPELTAGILNLIRILAKDGVTMLVITHHLEFARQISDRILFVDEGKLIEESAPDIFFSDTKNGRIKQFLASMLKQEKDVTIYEWEEEFQAYWLGKLNMLPGWTTGYIVGAVGNTWFDAMWDSYKKYEDMMIKKAMRRKLLGYEYTSREQEAKNSMKDLFEMKVITQDTHPLANFNIWWDTLMIQIFDKAPKLIEIKNKAVVESYINYFNVMRDVGKSV